LLGSSTLTNHAGTISWNPATYGQLDAGNRTLTVKYLGDTWNFSSTNTVSYIASTRRTMGLTLVTNSSSYVRPTTISMSVTSNVGSSYMTGKVASFYVDNTFIQNASFAGSTASITIDALTLNTGTRVLTAQVSQDFAYYGATSNTSTITVAKGKITPTLTIIDNGNYDVSTPIILQLNIGKITNATVSIIDQSYTGSTGTYVTRKTFIDGVVTTTSLTTSTTLQVGNNRLNATFSGDENYENTTTSYVYSEKFVLTTATWFMTATFINNVLTVDIPIFRDLPKSFIDKIMNDQYYYPTGGNQVGKQNPFGRIDMPSLRNIVDNSWIQGYQDPSWSSAYGGQVVTATNTWTVNLPVSRTIGYIPPGNANTNTFYVNITYVPATDSDLSEGTGVPGIPTTVVTLTGLVVTGTNGIQFVADPFPGTYIYGR
jgi:hypothetical protein